MINKNLCMSQYLAFRFIKDENLNFYKGLHHKNFKQENNHHVTPCSSAEDMDKVMKDKISKFVVPNKTAIFLSGGMDSANVASYLPKGTKAYTFKCIVDGAIDETLQAKKYCEKYELDHEIIEIFWEDFEKYTQEILKYDGVPFHSIEVLLYKACKVATKAGYTHILTGGGDVTFGGLSKLLSKDWDFDEFIEQYLFLNPQKALKNSCCVRSIFENYRLPNNKIDYIAFINNIFGIEADTSYMHIFEMFKINKLDPYAYMTLANPLDLNRIRNGESKYLIRELFKKRYPNFEVPEKIPMPRATTQWLKDYKTTRPEFIPNCTENMTGDQKYLCWCLEQFLNMHEPLGEIK